MSNFVESEKSSCVYDSFSHSKNMCSEKTCATHCTDQTHNHCATSFCSVIKCEEGSVYCIFHCIEDNHSHCAAIYCMSNKKQEYVYCDNHCEDFGIFECEFHSCTEIKRCVYFSITHDCDKNLFCELHCESELHNHCKKLNCKNLVYEDTNLCIDHL